MDLTYLDLFKKIKELEQEVIKDIVSGKTKFADIPEIFMTQSIILNLVVVNNGCIQNFPFAKLDNIICLAACQLLNANLMSIPNDRTAWVSSALKEPLLKHLNEQDKTKFICKAFVERDHLNINYVPEELLNDRLFIKELCLVNPKILSVMAFETCDYELCSLAMDSERFTLACIPENWRTKDICLDAFNRNYKEVVRFPLEFINLAVIKEAVRLCGKDEVSGLLQLLPTDLIDDDLVLRAVQKNESSFSLIPFDKIHGDLVFNIASFLTKHETLHHIPESIFTTNLSHRLISCNPMLLYGIPLRFRNKGLCLEAVTANGMALGAVPTNIKNDDMFRTAVQNNGLALKYIPTPYRDEGIPIMAVEQNGEAIEYVPESTIDEVLCRKAVSQNPHSIYLIPKKLLSNELYMMALKELPDVLKLIPADMRTVDQCLLALQGGKALFDYIPMQLRDNPRIVRQAINLGLMAASDMNID